MEQEILKLQNDIQELQVFIRKMEAASTIPRPVAEAFKTRLGSLKDISTKTPASETVSVNESGSDSYGVLGVPDGFYRTADGKNIPYYND